MLFSLIFQSYSQEESFLMSGFFGGTKYGIYKSNDFISTNNIGYELGWTGLSYLHTSGDLLTEVSYSSNQIEIDGYKSSSSDRYGVNIKQNTLNISTNYLHYIKVPDSYNFNIGMFLGLGAYINNNGLHYTDYDYENTADIETVSVFDYPYYEFTNYEKKSIFGVFYQAGILLGVEKIRLKFLYQILPINTIEIITPNYICISLKYYLTRN